MKKIIPVCLAATLFSFSAAALQTGNKAVKLEVSKWLKNGPVPLNIGKQVPEAQRKDLYVLALWGSWSPACREAVPMLVYLQNKYRDKGLYVIAISRESRDKVEKFLDEYPQINYAVAVDNKSLTTLHYLGESRLLPRIYIINTDNEIIWDGEIADLSPTLKKIYAGAYLPETQKKVSALQQNLEVNLRTGNYPEAVKTSEKILQLDPENGFAIRIRMFIYENTRQIDNAWDFLESRLSLNPENNMLYFIKLDFIARFSQYNKYASKLAEEVKKRFHNDAQMLNNMAWGMLTRLPSSAKVLPPAVECIQRALEIARADKNNKAFLASCLNTMALAYYRCGLPEKALETQRKVSKLAMGDKAQNSSTEAEKLYESAVELQKKLK
ncbi:MAG: redoxin domain-containing protein [Victivallaceae bacterium]